MSRLASTFVVAAVMGACAAIAPAHSGEEAARVVDQTHVCGVAVHNGVRKIGASARRGFREDGRWPWLASVGVGNENGGPPAKLRPTPSGQIPISYQNWGFGASAGIDLAYPEPSPPHQRHRAGVSVTPRRACTPSRARVPLSPRGLDGFPADYFGDEVECVVPAKVVVRVRAVFTEPAVFRADPSQGALRTRRAAGAVREAAIAVRTTSGGPLAYATVSASGAARLFSGRTCTFR